MQTYTVEAEVVSSTTNSQPIVVKATMVLPITTKSKQASNRLLEPTSDLGSNPKKHQHLLCCPAAMMASIALFFMFSALLLLSQLNCFHTHFGLPNK